MRLTGPYRIPNRPPHRHNRLIMRFPLALLLACGFAAPVAADEKFVPPEYTIARTDSPPTIDGKLDDAVWKNAKLIDDFVFPWHTAGEKEPSSARLLWDDECL